MCSSNKGFQFLLQHVQFQAVFNLQLQQVSRHEKRYWTRDSIQGPVPCCCRPAQLRSALLHWPGSGELYTKNSDTQREWSAWPSTFRIEADDSSWGRQTLISIHSLRWKG
eukprot:3561626-Rhodomonas_salina.2